MMKLLRKYIVVFQVARDDCTPSRCKSKAQAVVLGPIPRNLKVPVSLCSMLVVGVGRSKGDNELEINRILRGP